MALALPDLLSLLSTDDLTLALTLVFTPPASCFVVGLTLPPATSVVSTLVVAKKVSFPFFSSCFFAARSRVGGGAGGEGPPGVGGVGGVGVVTPTPVSVAVGPSGPVLRMPCLGPALVGVKVVWIAQVWPSRLEPNSVARQLFVWAKSPVTLTLGVNGSPPAKAMRKQTRPGALQKTRNSCACGGLVVPTWRLPKSTVPGLRVLSALALLTGIATSATVTLSV